MIDASAWVELALGTPAGAALAQRLATTRDELHAPELIDLEVAQVMRHYVRSGMLAAADGETALALLDDLGVTRWGHRELRARVWALRDVCSAYDAAYVALAEALAAPLVTGDARLAAAARAFVEIELVG